MDNQETQKVPVEAAWTPPRHWVGLEELNPSYWIEAKNRENRGQEFFEKPIEYLEKIEKSEGFTLARRDFMTIMGASMAMAGFACARRPVHKIIPYVVQPEEINPGVASWYASTNTECGHDCGILIKNREGRPIKLEGNPDHPINRGALCARGQASVLNLYDPDRLKGPVARNRAGGGRREISWKEADAAVGQALRPGANVVVLSAPVRSPSTARLIREFLVGFGPGSRHVEYSVVGYEDIAEASALSYGQALVPHYSFDKAQFVLSLGADFLGTWISPVEFARDWVRNRKPDAKNSRDARLSKVVTFEPAFSITGASSDERFAIRPGDELKIALALAHELIVRQGRSRFAGEGSLVSVLSGYKPEAVAEEIGLEGGAQKIRELAEQLWNHRGKGLVVAGGVQSRGKKALALQVAVNLLNSALENEGSTVDSAGAYQGVHGDSQALRQLVADMNAGKVDVLLVHGSNPAFTFPKNMGFSDALRNVKRVVSIADREDETALMADFILPDHHFLENWGDSSPRRGVVSIQQPAMAPIHDTRAFQDSLILWAKGAGTRAGLIARIANAPAEANTWHDYLKANWSESFHREFGAGQPFEKFWENTLQQGVLSSKVGSGGARSFRVAATLDLPKYAPMLSPGILLALYESVAMADGRFANNPWLQEFPDPISSVTWDNFLSIAPALARQLGVAENDVVEVSFEGIRVELPVHVQPGLHASVATVAIGYGRRAAGKVGTEAGMDVYPFVQMEGSRMAFGGQSVSLRKTGRFYKLASTQWHTVTENRPIINDITLAEFQQNPATANHTSPHLRAKNSTMWPVHEYKGYRWGMAIDLNACTGCGACVIGCQSENNVPVVGRDQVRVGRQMHWIRIDRYFAGKPENPDVVFQPMLCQHCENAPCETVCPVLATVHDSEGMSVQAYNRCVGTRYCQNNCPYKVRRFNFFDHWKSYEGTMNLAWNPDVTVRTRGIMEKCSFCIQRITASKDKAKDEGRKLRDGELLTACQQSCPTEAITFGDINNKEWKVSQERANARAFRVLEDLNAGPAISYLTKVRNKAGSAAHHGGAEGGHHG